MADVLAHPKKVTRTYGKRAHSATAAAGPSRVPPPVDESSSSSGEDSDATVAALLACREVSAANGTGKRRASVELAAGGALRASVAARARVVASGSGSSAVPGQPVAVARARPARKSASVSPAEPSPPKRARSTAAVPVRPAPATAPAPAPRPGSAPSKSRSLPKHGRDDAPLAEPELPLRSKRARIVPAVEPSSIAHTTHTFIPASTFATNLDSPHAPPRRSASPAHLALSQSATSRSPSPLKSPAKDLSKVFEMFAAKPDAVEQPAKARPLARTGSRVAGMGGRSVKTSDQLAPPSPSLTRAHSQPVLSSPPSARPLGPTSSLPTLPASPIKPTRHVSHPSTAQIDSTAPAPRGVAGARRTYGGSRTFRRDAAEDSLAAPGRPRLPGLASRDTYSILRAKWGVDEEEELNDEVEEQSQLKTVTQMRAKGENSRFVDEFNYLVEGLVKGLDLAVRRASAIEVLSKVADQEFVRRLKSLALVERVYADFRKADAGSGDRALDPALALLLSTFVLDQRLTEPLLRIRSAEFDQTDETACDVLAVLSRMLVCSWAAETLGAAVVGKGVTKSDVRAVGSVRKLVDEAGLLDASGMPTTLRSMCLFAIAAVAAFAPRAIFQPQQLVCASGALDAVVITLIREASVLPLRLTRYEEGLDLLPADQSISVPTLSSCLSTIESCSPLVSSTSSHSILEPHTSTLVPALANLILFASLLGAPGTPTLLGALRLLIELTNADPAWSGALADCPTVVPSLVRLLVTSRTAVGGESQDVVEGRFNTLCLAIGVLTNLVETVPGVKDVLRDTHLNPACSSRKCIRACHCPVSSQSSAITLLAALFLDPLADRSDETERSFVNGYTALSLGLVMLDSPPNQVSILHALSGQAGKVEQLLATMDEVAEVHERERDEDDGEGHTSAVAESIRSMAVAVRERAGL